MELANGQPRKMQGLNVEISLLREDVIIIKSKVKLLLKEASVQDNRKEKNKIWEDGLIPHGFRKTKIELGRRRLKPVDSRGGTGVDRGLDGLQKNHS